MASRDHALTAGVALESDAPRRIQLKREKGWRLPPNTVKVDRSTKWGNPDRADFGGADLAVRLFRERITKRGLGPIHAILTVEDVRRELRGKNLACWCAPGSPCHGDVLLELANSSAAQVPGESSRDAL